MKQTNVITNDLANKINELDALAHTHASKAVDYAMEAGALLLRVKAELPHGQWLPWVEANIKPSIRQVQRYIATAQGKPISIRTLTGKCDTVSHLKSIPREKSAMNAGEWVNGSWRPTPGFFYLFKEDGDNYWVQPSESDGRWFHVCKHYNGPRMSTAGFLRRYTIFAPITDSAFTSEQYVGTTTPLGWIGVGDVLKSYGLKDFSKSLSLALAVPEGFCRPLGEPNSEDFYDDWHEILELKDERSATFY